MGYRRRDSRAAGGFPLLALGAKFGLQAIKKVGGKLLKSRVGRTAVKAGGALTLGSVPLPGGSLVKRAGRGVKAAVGGEPRKYRRMNAGNAKAARRAIRRIKAVRGLLQSIEKQLPKRAASKPRGKSCR
jgi:hypothetical protein